MFEYQFAYLFLDLIGLPIWLILFIHRKDLRHKMILLSFLLGFTGFFATHFYYGRDYWSPLSITSSPLLVEDFLFGFLFGGIGSVFYEEIFGKKFSYRHIRKHNWALFFVFIVGCSSVIFNIMFFNVGINSIYAALIGFLTAGLGIFIFRKDLIMDALISGFLCGIILLIGYVIALRAFPLLFQAFWQLDNLSGITIGKIPVEEILWAFGLGMVAGPMYEFYAGLKFRK